MIALFPSREVVLEVGVLMVRWYGLLWVLSFALAAYLLPRLSKYRELKLTHEDWRIVLAAGITGAVIGGRLGYILLYEPGYFVERPAEIFAIWDGGMASHGGFVGVGAALWWAAKKFKIDVLSLLDVIVVPVALGLAVGRIGNFINQELFSPPALAWFAVIKNLVVAGVCWWYLVRTSPTLKQSGFSFVRRGTSPLEGEVGRQRPDEVSGQVFSLFLILYGLLRFLVEFVRVQEFPGTFGFTRGQLFTLPLAAAGVLLWIWLGQKQRNGSARRN
ncbi:MAG: prolipoprotein diacylglyceryl transferase [Patescibacteria group bacterium]